MKKYLKGIVASVIAMFAFIPFVNAASHIVNFDAQGGTPSTISPIEGEDGASFLLPSVTKEGSSLLYWYYIDESCPEESPCHYAPLEGNEIKADWPAEITLYAKWGTAIDEVNITVDLPVGETISFPDHALPESAITVPSGSKYGAFPEGAGVIKGYDDDSAFSGTIEAGKEYYVELWVEANGGVFTADTVIKVNGKDTFKIGDYYSDAEGKLDPTNARGAFLMYAKVVAGEVAQGATDEEETTATTTEAATETTANTNATVANPQTGDSIYAYVSLAVISLLGLAVSKKKLFN